jgi:hypothetical protein
MVHTAAAFTWMLIFAAVTRKENEVFLGSHYVKKWKFWLTVKKTSLQDVDTICVYEFFHPLIFFFACRKVTKNPM